VGNVDEVAAWRLMDAAIGQALWRYAEAVVGHSDALPRLSSRLVRVRAGEYAKGRLRFWIRQMNGGGQLRTVILRTEKRKVGGSILPLTTKADQAKRPNQDHCSGVFWCCGLSFGSQQQGPQHRGKVT
jgi:hypothetical protein